MSLELLGVDAVPAAEPAPAAVAPPAKPATKKSSSPLLRLLTPKELAVGGMALGTTLAVLGRKSLVGTVGWLLIGAFLDEVLSLWLVQPEMQEGAAAGAEGK